MPHEPLALIKGAGDLASGVALRLHRAGFAIAMTETPRPTVVRRNVAFAEAVYTGEAEVEGVSGILVPDLGRARQVIEAGNIAIFVDPEARLGLLLHPSLVVDAIMAKRNLGTRLSDALAVVALGPGFTAGVDAHAVIETMRGHTLGRVITSGEALANTGVPGEVEGHAEDRVLRSPASGVFRGTRMIGDGVVADEIVGYVNDIPVRSRLEGVLRGILHSGLEVTQGFKVGDVDPRAAREHCFQVSDKALAIGSGVLEAACSLLGGVRFPQGQEEAGYGLR